MPASDQGVQRDRYLFMLGTLIFLTHGDRVLLLKGAPDKRVWSGRYNGVGGRIERGEDVLSAARRELREETGLEVPDLWLCGTITVDASEDVGVALFVLRGECQSITEPLASREGVLEWVPFDQIYNLPLVEDLPILLPRILQAKRGDPPFAAHYAYDERDQLVIRFPE